MKTPGTGGAFEDGSGSTPIPGVLEGPASGTLSDNEVTLRPSGAGYTFMTARTGGNGDPSPHSSAEMSPPAQSPEHSLVASLAHIEARFSGLDARQKRTEDAIAVLMSASHATVPRRIIPTLVQFG